MSFPRFAYVKGRGIVTVLTYDGNGYFTVLTRQDERVMVHRDRMALQAPRKA